MNRHPHILFKNSQYNSLKADECVKFDPNMIANSETLQCLNTLSELDNAENDRYFYHSDHIGSSSFITDRNGYASQHLQYLPFGELFVEQRSTANYYTPYKFSGKEKDEETSYSYFGARYYMSDVSVWLSVDPMAEDAPGWTPYRYCFNNPINLIDPNGMSESTGDGIFIDKNGTIVGNDGKNDGKVYVLKTTTISFGKDVVPGAGLNKDKLKETIDFIKDNSGNKNAFQSNDIAYKNSIEIDGSADNRQAMVDQVSIDNGQGGNKPNNNREFGGYNKNGIIVIVPPGDISDPRKQNGASIDILGGYSSFHGHPSGYALLLNYNIASYDQFPSQQDINNAGNDVHYQFGRSKSNQMVHIYNYKGVQATIPISFFVNFKK